MPLLRQLVFFTAMALVLFSCNKKEKEIELPEDPYQKRMHEAAIQIQQQKNWHFSYEYYYTPPNTWGGYSIIRETDTVLTFTMPSDSFVRVWWYEFGKETLLPIRYMDDTNIYFSNSAALSNPSLGLIYNSYTKSIRYYENSYHTTTKYYISITSY